MKLSKAPTALASWLAGVAGGPGGLRRYYFCQPPKLLAQEGKLPLMVMLHGCGQMALDFARLTRMHELAARERFFVLYLEQDGFANSKRCWNWCERTSGLAMAEAATLLAAVEQVSRQFAVDADRIALGGFSAGASMAMLMASFAPKRFKAVAMHSGVAPDTAMSTISAMAAMRGLQASPTAFTAFRQAAHAVAVGAKLPALLVLHGDADDIVAPGNADSAAAIWTMASGSAKLRERTWRRGNRHVVRESEFGNQSRTLVVLRKVEGMGHKWSGGKANLPFSDVNGPCATRMIWTFAKGQF
ncbi:poly(hydroxyalkanoate) depolymerase family esterase [Variovorax boronicumulans]|uniref:extracellular catalytic domain type 1 short-chain-length polyhydroxyalkanoate depolymerase n=1 Tax=Variovorax boronicumulans TaxID=436515 RepID=UPI00278B87BF|nr:alpha/beta fold hydrolase [Variovorax boronicumulans]MDQ0086054.1 poly(hydroxyalkanoate) depolymerase family esterase [Variovorax boronicumulans]